MLRVVLSAFQVWAVVVVALSTSWASAAERSISLIPGVDLPGYDYQVLKDTSVDACQAACTEDRLCRAFTFNERADWCFLKAQAGDQQPFADATSGRVEMSPTEEEIAAQREGEIPFPAYDVIATARSFASGLPTTDAPPPNAVYADLVQAGDEALAADNPVAAMLSYRQALAVVDNDPALWLKLANTALDRGETVAGQPEGDNSYDLSGVAVSAAVNAFLQSETVSERAEAMGALARGLELRQMWREAIATYRASLELADNATLQARLDAAVAQHGFRIVSNAVDAGASTPRICAVFSEPLPPGDTDLSS